MRTTVTLDPDTEQAVRRRMHERGESFKVALNALLREAVVPRDATEQFRTATASMGRPTVSLDRALQIAAELEDDELVRRSRAGA